MKTWRWLIVVCGWGLCVSAMGAQITWSGAGGDDLWSNTENWVGEVVPTATDAPLFADPDSPGKSVLDADRTVNGFDVIPQSPTSSGINIVHELDLGGNRLTINGNVGVHAGSYSSANRTCTWTVTNGVLQIGNATTARTLGLGVGSTGTSRGDLIMGPGSVFDAYLSTVTLGQGEGRKGVLDLRQATITRGDSNGVFRASTLNMAMGGHGDHARYNIEILFGDSLTSFEITSGLTIASGHRTSAYIGKLGTVGTTALPDNVDIKLGVSTSSRASVMIGHGAGWGVTGHLVAGSGGEFTGYLSSLTVGRKDGTGNETANGRLDLRNMDSVFLDVSGSTLIGNRTSTGGSAVGRVHLGPGTAVFNNLTIGPTSGSGLLDLYGTDVTVTNAMTVNATGLVSNRVLATSGSITIGPAATLTINAGGRIVLEFDSWTRAAGAGQFGLVVPGDQQATLQEHLDEGRIERVGEFAGRAVVYMYQGNSYVGIPAPMGTVIAIE